MDKTTSASPGDLQTGSAVVALRKIQKVKTRGRPAGNLNNALGPGHHETANSMPGTGNPQQRKKILVLGQAAGEAVQQHPMYQ